MTDEKILDRIRKLLAMSKDTSSPNEAAIAARRAEAMMRKHNIEEADAILENLDDESIVKAGSNTGYKTLPEWQSILSVQVAKLMDCECRAYLDYRRKTITFLGQREDAQVAVWIFEYLVHRPVLAGFRARALRHPSSTAIDRVRRSSDPQFRGPLQPVLHACGVLAQDT